MQGSSPHRCLSIDFNAVVLPDLDTPDLNQPNKLPQAYKLDDIKVEYHPHSKLPSIVHHFAAFLAAALQRARYLVMMHHGNPSRCNWTSKSQRSHSKLQWPRNR